MNDLWLLVVGGLLGPVFALAAADFGLRWLRGVGEAGTDSMGGL